MLTCQRKLPAERVTETGVAIPITRPFGKINGYPNIFSSGPAYRSPNHTAIRFVGGMKGRGSEYLFPPQTTTEYQVKNSMSTGFIDKVKGFLLDPTQTLIAHRDESLGDAMQYFIIFLVIYGALTGIVLGLSVSMFGGLAGASAGMGPLGAGSLAALGVVGMIIAAIVFIIIFGIIALFIAGILLHIFVWIAGGRKGLTTTLRAVIYSLTPNLIFGWIPLIGILAGFWSLALEILAIKELHEISTTRAFIAVFMPAIILAVLAFFFLAALVAVTPVTAYY